VFTAGPRGAITNHALSRENEALRAEIKKLEDEVQSLQSANEDVLAASREDSVYNEPHNIRIALPAQPRQLGPGRSEVDPWISRQPSIYISPEHELWSRNAAAYPPLFSFEQPQTVAEALLGPASASVSPIVL
jgi:cell division septum initiation protein DivIVA